MLEPIVANDLYEMTHLRLRIGGAMELMTKRKPALIAETKRELAEPTEPEKNVSHCPLLLSGT